MNYQQTGIAVDAIVIEVDENPQPGRRVSTGSSILDDSSIEELGRTFHSYKEGAYLLPNDGEEQNRLDMQHNIIKRLMDGRLAWAPVGEAKKVLDIATGTGIWAIEYAKLNPSANVIGTDLSLIQPTNAPPNCSFVKEDAENDEWLHPHKFDYIHLRLLFTCFDDFPRVLQRIYDNLEPGGLVEFQDHTPEVSSQDGSSKDTALETFGKTVIAGLGAIGRDALRMRSMVPMLEQAGFVDIQRKILPYPVGGWPRNQKLKDIGEFNGHNITIGLRSSIKMLMAAGLTEAEGTVLSDKVRAELRSGHVHCYLPFYVFWARKPLAT